MALVKDLSEAFFNSLIYFLRNSILTSGTGEFIAASIDLLYPGKDLTKETLPFIGINFYNTGDEFWSMPDEAGTRSRMMRYYFTIGVYCENYAQQRWLPQKVKRVIEKAVTLEGTLTKQGIQVYKGWSSSASYDPGSELCVAEPYLDMVYPLGGNNEESKTLNYRSMIDGVWWVNVDKTKVFIDSDI